MKSIITFICENIDCQNYDQQVRINIPDFFIGKCKNCNKTGELKIKHGGEEFNSSGSLIEYLKGLMKEQKLLNKMKMVGVADKDELNRIEDITDILDEAVCPCCNQKPTIEL